MAADSSHIQPLSTKLTPSPISAPDSNFITSLSPTAPQLRPLAITTLLLVVVSAFPTSPIQFSISIFKRCTHLLLAVTTTSVSSSNQSPPPPLSRFRIQFHSIPISKSKPCSSPFSVSAQQFQNNTNTTSIPVFDSAITTTTSISVSFLPNIFNSSPLLLFSDSSSFNRHQYLVQIFPGFTSQSKLQSKQGFRICALTLQKLVSI